MFLLLRFKEKRTKSRHSICEEQVRALIPAGIKSWLSKLRQQHISAWIDRSVKERKTISTDASIYGNLNPDKEATTDQLSKEGL